MITHFLIGAALHALARLHTTRHADPAQLWAVTWFLRSVGEELE